MDVGRVLTGLLCLGLFTGWNPGRDNREEVSPDTTAKKFTNPVFEPILADPTVVRAGDGWFYAYGTQDDWGDGKGSRLVPVVRSRDLVHWTYTGQAFENRPAWKDRGGIWAPDVVRVNGRYHLYYACSVWADADPGIGVAVADTPEGPFRDSGKLFLSSDIGVPNSIDPFYFEDGGTRYLFWGSYSEAAHQGTYGVPLAADGLSVPDFSAKFKIAAGDFEAVVIHRRNGYYYFIGSKEGCCDGAESRYHLRVGRSRQLRGPYTDREGRLLTGRGAGDTILQGDAVYAGPGHCSRIITDDNGTDWLLYHAIDRKQPYVPSKANRRVLMLDKVTWEEGWPLVGEGVPSDRMQAAPVFRK